MIILHTMLRLCIKCVWELVNVNVVLKEVKMFSFKSSLGASSSLLTFTNIMDLYVGSHKDGIFEAFAWNISL